jgi:hypothetical protein
VLYTESRHASLGCRVHREDAIAAIGRTKLSLVQLEWNTMPEHACRVMDEALILCRRQCWHGLSKHAASPRDVVESRNTSANRWPMSALYCNRTRGAERCSKILPPHRVASSHLTVGCICSWRAHVTSIDMVQQRWLCSSVW